MVPSPPKTRQTSASRIAASSTTREAERVRAGVLGASRGHQKHEPQLLAKDCEIGQRGVGASWARCVPTAMRGSGSGMGLRHRLGPARRFDRAAGSGAAVAEVDEVLHVALGSGVAGVADTEDARPGPRATRDRSSTSTCTARSRTTPPLPTRSRPASNCGLTRARPRYPERRHSSTGPRASVREMNDTSAVTKEGGNGRRSRVRCVRSCVPDGHSRVLAQPPVELAVADVDGDDRAAPPCRRQSTKPPVELPRSQPLHRRR